MCVCHHRFKQNNENTVESVAELHKLAENCIFAKYLNDFLQDWFVCGYKQQKWRKPMLRKACWRQIFDIKSSRKRESYEIGSEGNAVTLRCTIYYVWLAYKKFIGNLSQYWQNGFGVKRKPLTCDVMFIYMLK